MSYWGITVMINIVAVLPCCGVVIAELIWSAAWIIRQDSIISLNLKIYLSKQSPIEE